MGCNINPKKGYDKVNVKNILSENFKSYFKSVKESSKAGDINVSKAIYDWLYNKYKDNKDYPNNVIADSFKEWLKISNEIAHTGLVNFKSNKTTLTKIEKLKAKNIQNFRDEDFEGALDNYSETLDGEVPNNTNEGDGASHYKDAGIDFLNSFFFRGLGIRILEKDYAFLADKAKNETLQESISRLVKFIQAEGKKYNKDFSDYSLLNLSDYQLENYPGAEKFPILKLKSMLKEWHVSNLSTNKRLRSEIQEYVLGDWIEIKKDKETVIHKDNWLKRGLSRLFHAPLVNILSGRKESKTQPVGFLQEESVPYGKEDTSQTLDKNTGYLPFRNIVRAHKNKGTGETYFKPDNRRITKDFLMNTLDPGLIKQQDKSSPYGRTIVATTSGSSSKVYIANILEEHYNILVPKDFVQKLIDSGFIAERIQKYGFDGQKAVEFIQSKGGLIEAIRSDELRSKAASGQRQAMMRIVDGIAQRNYKKFIAEEQKLKNITDEQAEDFLDTITNPSNKKIGLYAQLASQIARHRWWQTATIDNYLMSKDSKGLGTKNTFGLGNSPMDYFDRLKIGNGKGLVVVGTGSTKSLLIDPEVGIEKNKKKRTWKFKKLNKDTGKMEYQEISPEKFIKALGSSVYKGDGTLFRDSATYNKWAEKLGAETFQDDQAPMASAKTVRRNKDENGYSLDKSLSTIAPPGLRVIDNVSGEIVLETKLNSKGEVVMIGPNKQPINEFLTNDERKVSTGSYSKDLEVTNTKEGSERIVWKSGKYAHNDVAFPVQLIDLLEGFGVNTKEFAASKVLQKHALRVIDDITTEISEMMKSPVKFRKAIDSMFKNNNEDLESEARKLYNIYKDAPDHPALMSYFLPMLKNRYITDGAFKLRAMDKKDYGGSYFELKWDIGEQLIDSSYTMVSPNNQKIWNVVKERYLDITAGKKAPSKTQMGVAEATLMFGRKAETEKVNPRALAESYFNKLTKEAQLKELNDFLNKQEVSVLVSRHPVDSKSAVRLKRIQEFTGWWDSDSAYLDADFVYGPLRADHDGDHVNLEVLPDDIAQELKPFLSDASAFIDDDVNLDWFEDLFKNKRMSNIEDFFEVMSSVVSSAGSAMGQAYNMRTVRGNLVRKDFRINLDDGTYLIPIRQDERVFMDYIYLDKDLDENILPDGVDVYSNENYTPSSFNRAFNKEPLFVTTEQVGETYRLVLYKDGKKINPGSLESSEQLKTAELTAGKRTKWLRENNLPEDTPYFTEQMGEQQGKAIGKEIPEGKRIIEVTSEHEMAILANAATDNPKKLKLTQMGFNGDPAFFVSKYFWRVDGNGEKHRINDKPDPGDIQGKEIINILLKVQTHFNHSKKRQGKNNDKESSIQDILSESAKLDDLLNQKTPEEYSEYLKKLINSDMITDINQNSEKSVVEEMLIRPFEKLEELQPDETYPFSSLDPNNRNTTSKVFAPTAHYLAMEALLHEIQAYSKLGVTNKQIKIAKKWLNENYDSFYDLFTKKKQNDKEVDLNPSVRKIDFNEEIAAWHKKVVDEDFTKIKIEDLEGVKKVITIEFLSGNRGKKNIATMPSVDLLDHGILQQYITMWNQKRNELKDGKAIDLAGKEVVNPYTKEHVKKGDIIRKLTNGIPDKDC